MSIFERFKNWIKRINNRTPQIEAPQKENSQTEAEQKVQQEIKEGYIAPKRERDEEDKKSFSEQVRVSEKDLLHRNVTFEQLDPAEEKQLLSSIDSMIPGWTHEEWCAATGKLDGQSYVGVNRIRASYNKYVQETIKTANTRYEVSIEKETQKLHRYTETEIQEDGTLAEFSVNNEDKTASMAFQKGRVLFLEVMNNAPNLWDKYSYMQPSDELWVEYAKATGLPVNIPSRGNYSEMMDIARKNGIETSTSGHYYVVYINATQFADENHERREKKIEYAYESKDAYLNGEKPVMIYMDGIDGRSERSGMFRLKGDVYVDNSTFRKENGEYTYDVLDYEQVMSLAGNMPTQPTETLKRVVKDGFNMPSGIYQIFKASNARNFDAPMVDNPTR